MSIVLRTSIRTIFRSISAIAPVTAGNLAFRLFCRPVKASSVAPIQRAMITRGEKILQTAKTQSIPFGGADNIATGTIQCYTFEPPASITGTTLLLHGWSSRATHMLAFVEPLLEQGQRVLAIDFPAHGQSSGRSFHLPMAVQAVHAVRQHLQTFDTIIAHSLGGAVASTMIAGGIKGFDAVPVKRLVLISTPNSMPDIFTSFADMIGLNPAARTVLDQHVIRLSGKRLETFIGSEQLRQSGTPTLVLHDPEDNEIAGSEAHALAQAGDLVTVKEIEDVGHRRILYSPAAVKLATEFVAVERREPADPVSI